MTTQPNYADPAILARVADHYIVLDHVDHASSVEDLITISKMVVENHHNSLSPQIDSNQNETYIFSADMGGLQYDVIVRRKIKTVRLASQYIHVNLCRTGTAIFNARFNLNEADPIVVGTSAADPQQAALRLLDAFTAHLHGIVHDDHPTRRAISRSAQQDGIAILGAIADAGDDNQYAQVQLPSPWSPAEIQSPAVAMEDPTSLGLKTFAIITLGHDGESERLTISSVGKWIAVPGPLERLRILSNLAING